MTITTDAIGGHHKPIVIDNGGGDYTVPVIFGDVGKVDFVGPGTYNVTVDAALFAKYTIEASNGAVVNYTADFAIATKPHVVIDGASTVSFTELFSAASPVDVNFKGGPGGTLILPPADFGIADGIPTIHNFGLNDNISFNSKFKGGEKYVYTPNKGDTAGTLSLETKNGHVIGSVKLIGVYAQGDFSVVDVNGKAEIVSNVPCFVPGTMIATPDGQVAVETLRAGDLVLTLANGARPVVAVRTRSFPDAADYTSAKLRPVRIAAGALGEGLPHRDLFVSPDHSMYLDGVLVPAQLLVNNITITQPQIARAVEYVHVELQPHDIIIAEGAASESYLDIGNVGHFGAPGVVTLFSRVEPKSWEDACAPIVLAGPQLARIRASLLATATALVGETELAEVA